MTKQLPSNQRNYTPWIIGTTIIVNVMIAVLFFIPKQDHNIPIDLTLLPRLNAIFNAFTFVFLLSALFFIRRKNITMHRNFIFAAFSSTARSEERRVGNVCSSA